MNKDKIILRGVLQKASNIGNGRIYDYKMFQASLDFYQDRINEKIKINRDNIINDLLDEN